MPFHLSNRALLIIAIVLANALLSSLSIYLDPVINNDGITYLSMAELYLRGDWETAKSYYSWPFYPLLVAGLSQLLSLEVVVSAHILNTLLATSLSLAFIAIVGELSDNDITTLLIAAFVILLFPSITKYRAYIIRDFGYLSFYLWSLFFIFRFCRSSNKNDLIGWFFSSAASCIFRFEGIILILVVPYFLFVFSNTGLRHKRKLIAALTLSIITICASVVFFYLQDKYDAKVQLAQLAGQDIDGVVDLFMDNIKTQSDHSSSSIFSYLSPVFDNLINILNDIVRRMAGIYFLICIAAYLGALAFQRPLRKRIWAVYIATNLSLLLAFSLANNITVSRYTLAICLTLLPLAPIALSHWLKNLEQYRQWQKVTFYITACLVIGISLKNLDIRSNKVHLIEAGTWINQNLGDDISLFSNERILVHYADLGPKSNFIDRFTNQRLEEHLNSGNISQYDYIALTMNKKQEDEVLFNEQLRAIYGAPTKKVTGSNGRSVMIYTKPNVQKTL